MANICLLIGTTAPLDQVMAALNTIEGLSKWWTTHTSGSTAPGDIIHFRFPDNGTDMRVLESTDRRVVWESVAEPDEWRGTHLSFDVSEQDGQTIVMFKHAGWADETPFFHHCSTKWGVFMISLKSYLDTGAGQPFPNDTQITVD